MIALSYVCHAASTITIISIASLSPGHAQGVFDVVPYQLSVEEAKASSTSWTLKETKLSALLATDVAGFYYRGVAKTDERRRELEAELHAKKDDLLQSTFRWQIGSPALHVHDTSQGFTRFGFAIDPPIAFPQVPIRRITLGSPLLTADVRYIDLPTEKSGPLEEGWDDHHFLWIFRVADDAHDLHAEQLRLMIFNKYSEEVVYDHVFL